MDEPTTSHAVHIEMEPPPRGKHSRGQHPSRDEQRPDHGERRPHFAEPQPHGGELRRRRRQSDAPSYHSSGDEEEEERWMDEERKLELLQNLPSRRLDQSLADMQDMNRRKSSGKSVKRRKSHHNRYFGSVRGMKGLDAVDSELQRELEEEQDMIGDEEAADIAIADHLREASHTTLARKRMIKSRIQQSSSTRRQKQKKISCFTSFRYRTSMAFRHLKRRIAEVRYSLGFWRGHLKTVEGHFGTGVLSYFQFLRWLFKINVGVFLLSLGFLIVPQLLYRVYFDDGYSKNNMTFTGYTELLTGGGWFEQTEMYYGYYTHTSIEVITNFFYNMPYAYLLTCGGYYLLCLIILATSSSTSYRQNYIEGSDEFDSYPSKVFCGWDYGITADNAAKLKQKSIHKELRELLAGFLRQKEQTTCCGTLSLFFFRVFTNIVIIGLLAGSAYLIWYVSITQSLKTDVEVLGELAMPLCVSGINLVLPFAFTIIASFEKYKQPKTELFLTMIRTVVLNFVTIGVLIYFWFNDVDCMNNAEEVDKTQENKIKHCVQCWETFMGKQIYMLALVDFIFILLFTFISEFIRRLLAICCTSLGRPEFNIGRNTLNLVYSQALCWLGSFYCPFLPFIQVIKLFVIFYTKRVSVMQNCVPSSKPWRASIATTFFQIILFLSFLFASFSVGYSIWKITPSTTCGPYKGLNTSYVVVFVLIKEWDSEQPWIADVINFLSSAGAIAAILTVLCVFVYYSRIVSIGRKEAVTLLKNQLSLEGKDKMFLLKMLQDASKEAVGGSTKQHRTDEIRYDDSSLPSSPGGKKFAKHGKLEHKPGTPKGANNNNIPKDKHTKDGRPNKRQDEIRNTHSDSPGMSRRDIPGVEPDNWERPGPSLQPNREHYNKHYMDRSSQDPRREQYDNRGRQQYDRQSEYKEDWIPGQIR